MMLLKEELMQRSDKQAAVTQALKCVAAIKFKMSMHSSKGNKKNKERNKNAPVLTSDVF